MPDEKVLTWQEIKTVSQKNKLVEAVIGEIMTLRKSPAIKELLGDSVVIAVRLRQELVMFKDGSIEHHDINKIYGSVELDIRKRTVNDDELASLIKDYKINPGMITTIQREIEA